MTMQEPVPGDPHVWPKYVSSNGTTGGFLGGQRNQILAGIISALVVFGITTIYNNSATRLAQTETRLAQVETTVSSNAVRQDVISQRVSADEVRLAAVEASSAVHDLGLGSLRSEVDTINARGTLSADTRISALETRVSVADGRLTRLEQAITVPSTRGGQ